MPLNEYAAFPPEFPIPGPLPSPEGPHPRVAIPIVYEKAGDMDELSLRTWAAVQLRVPESGIDWLDRMIRKSRELDRGRGARRSR